MALLTKPFSPKDVPIFYPPVDANFNRASPQHPARRWEYMLALEAEKEMEGGELVDVGGAGSPLYLMTTRWLTIVDPDVQEKRKGPPYWKEPLEEYAKRGYSHPGVFCISVIEHVDDLPMFLLDLAKVTKKDGILFLTMDAWNEPPEKPDVAHFHWMRKRIFTKESWKALAGDLHSLGFVLLGEADWDSPIEELEPGWGYGFVSLCMRKR